MRFRLLLSFCLAGLLIASLPAFTQTSPTVVNKLGFEMDVRSDTRYFLDELAANGSVILPDAAAGVSAWTSLPQVQFRGGNLQVNDPGLDTIQQFTGFRPFVNYIQSETSLAAFGQNIVATYNNAAGAHLVQIGSAVGFDRLQFSGFSVSNDGGRTFTSGFFPGVDGDVFTFGDPSADVDRNGNFYFAQLGETADGQHGALTVNKSTDGGRTWQNAVVAAIDDASDKEWIAVGPDPFQRNQDNVYVTWTSFQAAACELRMAKSTDGGATWTSKTIFTPTVDPNPTHPTNCLQFSNPVVDRITGSLYVPFLHFSNADSDFIQMVISDDGGNTFRFATFNVAGAPSPTLMPLVQPGEFIECGATRSGNRFSVNLRLALHQGANIHGAITGLARYINATRLIVQPAVAARNGVVYLAWNTSTSPFFGDPNGHSNIMFTRSDDAGNSWTTPIVVNPPGDPQHVHPSLTLDSDPQSVHISYYTQHADESIDLDMANSLDRGNSFPADRAVRVSSTSFNLPPTNVPIPSASNPFATTNFDRVVAQCYALGEYQSALASNGRVYVLWGDTRNTVMQPVSSLDPISGKTHPQADVFFQIVKAQ